MCPPLFCETCLCLLSKIKKNHWPTLVTVRPPPYTRAPLKRRTSRSMSSILSFCVTPRLGQT